MHTDWTEIGTQMDIETARRIIPDARAAFQDLAEDLRAVRPPADVQDFHHQLILALSDGAEALRDLEELLDKPPAEVLKELETLEPRMAEAGEAFYALGNMPPAYDAAFESEPECRELEAKLQ